MKSTLMTVSILFLFPCAIPAQTFSSGSTAAALRAAQVEMWQTSRWPSPYFWAGFVLQGEWK